MTFVQGVRIPESKFAREITELIRDTESQRFEVDGAKCRAKSGGRGASARQFLRRDPGFGVAVVTRLRSPYIS